jgi:Rrf2 family protein
MKVSTRTRYGMRALAELAAARPHGVISVRQIADAQNVSPKYLEQIMGTLRAAGLVEGVHGVNGGYRLARAPEDILLGEVFRLFEGSTAVVACVDDSDVCPMKDVCPTRDTWVEIKDAVDAVLARTSVRDLAERALQMRVLQKHHAPMYYI